MIALRNYLFYDIFLSFSKFYANFYSKNLLKKAELLIINIIK